MNSQKHHNHEQSQDDSPTPDVYILRWNPQSSEYTIRDYINSLNFDRICKLEELDMGFSWPLVSTTHLTWTLREMPRLRDFRRAPLYFMMNVDTDNPGIMFCGRICGVQYRRADNDSRRYDIDITMLNARRPDQTPLIPLSVLQKELPHIDWLLGPDSELISEEDFLLLDDLLIERHPDAVYATVPPAAHR